MKVGIIDYSAGNVSSLISMLDTLKYEHYYTNNEKTTCINADNIKR